MHTTHHRSVIEQRVQIKKEKHSTASQMNMDSELKQAQSIAPEDYYEEEDQDEIVNDNIATLQKEDATPENTMPPQQANPMPAPAAPRKGRKATTAK